MFGFIVYFLVNPKNNCYVRPLGGSGDNNFSGSRFKMFFSAGSISKFPRAFHNYVHSQVFPGQCFRFSCGKSLNLFTIDDNRVASGFNFRIQCSMYGIIFQQMSKCPGVCEVVYGHELYIFIFISGPENQPADSSKAINGNLYSHIILLTYFFKTLVKSLVVVNAFNTKTLAFL